MIKFTLKLKPITKKNHQQILKNKVTGKYFVAPSKQYQDYEEAALWLIPKFRQLPINYPVNVKCLFYMPTKAKCDLTNLLESIDDVMVKAGVLADDNYTIIESHDGSRVLYDKDNPRTEVEITRIEEPGDMEKLKNCTKCDCTKCRHFEKESGQYPCSHCRNCYINKFQSKEGD